MESKEVIVLISEMICSSDLQLKTGCFTTDLVVYLGKFDRRPSLLEIETEMIVSTK